MSLDDIHDFTSPGPQPEQARRARGSHPSGWEPGIRWDGESGTIVTEPLDRSPDWDAVLRVWDLDPEVFQVLEPVQFRAWDASLGRDPETGKAETTRFFYYKANVVRRRTGGPDVEELVKAIRRHKRGAATAVEGHPFVHPMGDLQAGKPDGDGTAGTVRRFLDGEDLVLEEYRQLRKRGRVGTDVYLPWLGDCIEGNNSQGGANVARNDLTVTESVRVVRHLMLHQVKLWAPHASRLIIPVIPGNHDEALRIAGRMGSWYDDSWAIEAASAVAMAVGENPALEHVSFIFPQRDELTLTLDIGGTITGLAHGHQFGRDVDRWWADQAHGQQPIGDATVLIAGHLHHYVMRDTGSKTFWQIQALDGGSTWYRHRRGADAPAGVSWAVLGEGRTWEQGRVAL